MRNNKGVAAIILFVLILAIVAVAVTPIIMEGIWYHSISEHEKAFYLAESGIRYYIKKYLSGNSDWRDNTPAINNMPFSGGNFSVVPFGDQYANIISLQSTGSVSAGSTEFSRSIQYTILNTGEGPPGVLVSGCGIDLNQVTNATVDGGESGTAVFTGCAYTTDSATNMEVIGRVSPGELNVTIPTPDWIYWQGLASGVNPPGNIFDAKSGPVYNGIYYVEGNARIEGNITVNGTIVARGSIITSKPGNNIVINPDEGRPALIAEVDINFDKPSTDLKAYGAMYAGNNIFLNQMTNFTMKGSLIAKNNLSADIITNSSMSYDPNANFDGFIGAWSPSGGGGPGMGSYIYIVECKSPD